MERGVLCCALLCSGYSLCVILHFYFQQPDLLMSAAHLSTLPAFRSGLPAQPGEPQAPAQQQPGEQVTSMIL